MSKFRSLIRISLRFFAALLGLALLAYLVFVTGPGIIWKQFQTVGWGLVLIIILGGVSQLLQTCAWRQTFACDISNLSWPRSFGVQLISDAAGQLGIPGKLLGDGLRVSLLGTSVPLPSAISAAAIDGGLQVLTAAVVTLVAIIPILLVAHISGAWRTYALVTAAVLLAVVALTAVAVANRLPLMGNAARKIRRLPILQNWISSKLHIIDSAENNLLDYYRVAPAAFWKCVMFYFLWHALAVLEVVLILRFMGANIAVISGLIVEGLTKVINLVGAVNPGNLGTYEGGNILIARVLGVSGSTGLTLALCRRARSIFWAAVGALCMILMKKPSGAFQAAAAQ